MRLTAFERRKWNRSLGADLSWDSANIEFWHRDLCTLRKSLISKASWRQTERKNGGRNATVRLKEEKKMLQRGKRLPEERVPVNDDLLIDQLWFLSFNSSFEVSNKTKYLFFFITEKERNSLCAQTALFSLEDLELLSGVKDGSVVHLCLGQYFSTGNVLGESTNFCQE